VTSWLYGISIVVARRPLKKKANGQPSEPSPAPKRPRVNTTQRRIEANRQNAKKGGRPPGHGRNTITRMLMRRAKESGELPHEFLLRVMQTGLMPDIDKDGQPCMLHVGPTMRIEAAARAAPFYAPRLSAIRVDGALGAAPLTVLLMDLLRQGNASKAELDMLEQLVRRVHGTGQSAKLLEVKPAIDSARVPEPHEIPKGDTSHVSHVGEVIPPAKGNGHDHDPADLYAATLKSDDDDDDAA